jgi:hypothetical protein
VTAAGQSHDICCGSLHQNILVRALVLFAFTIPALAQRADVAVIGGGGIAGGEEQNTHGVSAMGAAIGFPYAGRHRVQFDYLFNHPHTSGSENRHFITGSYLIQGQTGRARPFFQIGAGAVVQTYDVFFVGAPGFSRRIEAANDTSFAVVIGGGATVEMGRSFFIRPEVRVYGHVGPTLTVLPSVAFGYRF